MLPETIHDIEVARRQYAGWARTWEIVKAGWCQGVSDLKSDGNRHGYDRTYHCLASAISAAGGTQDDPWDDRSFDGWIAWNDAETTSKAMVLAVLQAAMNEWRERIVFLQVQSARKLAR